MTTTENDFAGFADSDELDFAELLDFEGGDELEDADDTEQTGASPLQRDPSVREMRLETLVFEIPKLAERLRVDAYLSKKVKYATRNRVQKAIAEGRVTVNGKAVKNAYGLQAGDRLELTLLRPAATDMVAEELPLEILYEDPELIVLNKPPGIPVHPTYRHWSGTLANGLLFYFRQQLGDMQAPIKPGLIHRLDKGTSGVLVVGKTPQAKRLLSKQFEKRQSQKRYQALVWGAPSTEGGLLETNLGPSSKDRRVMANFAYQGRQGKPARSRWQVLQRFGSAFALLEVELLTGRTHQIRSHLAHLGHPILGDNLYGPGRELPEGLGQLLQRQALHAVELGFSHPASQHWVSFRAPLSADLQASLDWLAAQFGPETAAQPGAD